MTKLVGIDIESEERVGEGGFLTIRRQRLVNRRDDGSRSAPYSCDVVDRPFGLDAVAVAIYRVTPGGVEVLLRGGLRPPLVVGRAGATIPVADRAPYLLFTEVVAGIIECDDRGEQGIKSRAAIEVFEEAGLEVSADDIVMLGGGLFPSPGLVAEKLWFTAVEVAEDAVQSPASGDGSPMEEGAESRWVGLDAAIAASVRGEIEDLKTELALRRLADLLAGKLPAVPAGEGTR